MTYFDPNIYNKYNLSPADRGEVDFWEGMMDNAFENVRFDLKFKKKHTKNPIKKWCVKKQLKILDKLEDCLAGMIEDFVVSRIESYDCEDFEKYKAAGDKEREEKGIVYEVPYASLKVQPDDMQAEKIDVGDE